MNKRELAKAATRAKLIEVARTLWAEPGTYEAVTIRVIAKAAGYSTGAIFANFDSKEDLWREAMGFEPPVDSAVVRAVLVAAEVQAELDRELAAFEAKHGGPQIGRAA